jgi:hypothetical protein
MKTSTISSAATHEITTPPSLLDRRLEAPGPNQRWVGDTTEFCHRLERQALSGRHPRSVLTVCRRPGRERRQRSARDDQSARHGAEVTVSRRRPSCITVTRLHVRERGLSSGARSAWHPLRHKPARQLLRQRRDGELLLERKERSGRPLRQLRRGQDGVVRFVEVFYNERRRHSTLGQIMIRRFLVYIFVIAAAVLAVVALIQLGDAWLPSQGARRSPREGNP